MTKAEFRKILHRIGVYYSDFESKFDRERMTLWYERLGMAPYSLLERAVDRYVMEQPYPPKICDIRKTAEEIFAEDRRKEQEKEWAKMEEDQRKARELEHKMKLQSLRKAQ